MKKSKIKLSKYKQKLEDQKINKQLRRKYEEKTLKDDRKIEDDKDKIVPISAKDINNFNSENLLDALKQSGIDTSSSVFADMERIVNSNESIRELVDTKNIRMKTNVTDEQHKIITILYGAYDTLLSRYGIRFKGLEKVLNEFIELSPSIAGVRAVQFVTAHQAVAQAVANANKNPNAITTNEGKQ